MQPITVVSGNQFLAPEISHPRGSCKPSIVVITFEISNFNSILAAASMPSRPRVEHLKFMLPSIDHDGMTLGQDQL